jgi:hypothetical protein
MDDQGINTVYSIYEILIFTENEVTNLCNTMKLPGGLVPAVILANLTL